MSRSEPRISDPALPARFQNNLEGTNSTMDEQGQCAYLSKTNTPGTDDARRQIRSGFVTKSPSTGQAPNKDRGHDTKESSQRRYLENNRGARGERQRGGGSSPASVKFQPKQFPDNGRRRETTRHSIEEYRRSESLGSSVDAVASNQQQERSRRSTFNSHHRASAHPPVSVVPSSSSTAFFGNCDDSRYWDYAFRFTHRGDLGHLCRECKRPFSSINETIAIRSQPTSSANVGKFVDALKGTAAPEELYRKMRARGHW